MRHREVRNSFDANMGFLLQHWIIITIVFMALPLAIITIKEEQVQRLKEQGDCMDCELL